LREEDPVHESHDGLWLISSYELTREVVMSKEFIRRGATDDYSRRSTGMAREYWVHQMTHRDDPDHGRLRKLVQMAFTVRAVQALREQAGMIVAGHLERLRPLGEMELLSDLSYPFTTEMICRIMGVPYSMNSTLGRWVVDLVNGHLPMATEEDVRVADQAAAEALEYFGALAEQ